MSEAAKNGSEAGASGTEQRYQDLVEWLPAVVYEAEYGAHGAWHFVSPYSTSLLGYSPEEITSNPSLYYSRLHPDDRETVLELEHTQRDMARRDGVTVVSEYRMLHRDGHVVWVRDEARMVPSPGGGSHWRGILVDVTDARTAELALAESHERYRGLVNSLPVCAYEAEAGPARRRTFLTPHLRELIGYSPDEWEADPARWSATLHPDDRERVLREEERHADMATGTPWMCEYRLLSRAGEVVWVRDRAVVAERGDGRRVIDGILTDITAVRNRDANGRPVPDVLRLTCRACGLIRPAEHASACEGCGSADVDAVSLNAVSAELESARRQVETLLDGVHQHLETVSTKPDRQHVTRSALSAERRAWTRPG